jgi:hypothetical protein
MTYFILASLAALTLSLLAILGVRKALWIIWPLCALVLPGTLAVKTPGGISVNPQLMPLLLLPALLSSASREARRSGLRWCLADTLMLLMFVCQNISNINNGTYYKLTTVWLFLTWVAPYILGRLYLTSEQDLAWALRPLCVCLAALCLFMLVESLTGLNLLKMASRVGYHSANRGVLRRASGAMGHPIYQGIVLVLMSPLALEAAARARSRNGPTWWQALPWLVLAAVLGTVSRGPMMAILGTMSIYLFCRRAAWRVPIGFAWCALAALLILSPEAVKTTLYAIGGEDKFVAENERIVRIGDDEVQYSGADHRWILFHVYAKPLANAGFFGYGYGKKGSLIEGDFGLQASYFSSIDNNFIYHILTYGYLGMSLFMLLALIAILSLARAAWGRSDSLARLAVGMFGAILTVNLALLGVGMTSGYLMFWPFTTGLGLSVAQLARAAVPALARAPTSQVARAVPWAWQPAGAVALGGQPGLMPNPNNASARMKPG